MEEIKEVKPTEYKSQPLLTPEDFPVSYLNYLL